MEFNHTIKDFWHTNIFQKELAIKHFYGKINDYAKLVL